MTYKDMLVELKNLARLKNNWYSVAKAVDKAKEVALGPQPARRLKEASEACGYSPNTLSRMLGVKEFFDAVKEKSHDLQRVDPDNLSFPSLEIVKRLHQVDAEEAIRKLTDVAKQQVTFRELRDHYYQAISNNAGRASAHQIARLEAKDFEDAALKAVISAKGALCGASDVEIETRVHQPISAVAYKKNTMLQCAGFEFFFLRDLANPKQVLESMLYRILFYSGFFNRFWVLFASTTGDERIEDFTKILHELDRRSIGVAVLPWGNDEHVLGTKDHIRTIRFPVDSPAPDWRQKQEIISSLRKSWAKARAQREDFGT